MDSLAVETRELAKQYGDVTALAGIDLAIPAGSFFGLLGPNGAGKTTAVSILCTLMRPSSGQALVFGHDAVRERAAVRPCLGIVFQDPSLDTTLTGRENLDIHGRLYRISDRAQRVQEVLDLMGMADEADRACAKLSGGQRRRLEIARGLMHEPRVLFLDEPTLGLDVHARRTLWERLECLRESGLTLVLTTHAMDEAERLCDTVAIVNQGRVVVSGRPRELCATVGGDHIELELERASEAASALAGNSSVRQVTVDGPSVVLTVENAPQQLVAIIEALKPLGIHGVRMRQVNLEDAFVHFIGQRIGSAGDLE